MCKVTVVSVEDGGYYESEYASGETVDVTLQRGDVQVCCTGILLWDDSDDLNAVFEEWLELAEAGEEGFSYTTVA